MLAKSIEQAAVRTSRAENRRPGDGLYADILRDRLFSEDSLPKKLRVEFIQFSSELLADAGNALRTDLHLHEIVQLLNNIELIYFRSKIADELHRQRICKSELQKRSVFRKSVLCVLVGNGSGDDANLRTLHFDTVQRADIAVFR